MAWPPDIDDNALVDIFDVVKFKTHFGSTLGDPAYSARFDLDASGSVDIFDVLEIKPFFAAACSP